MFLAVNTLISLRGRALDKDKKKYSVIKVDLFGNFLTEIPDYCLLHLNILGRSER